MILIVDDDRAVRSSLSLLLKRAGYETQSVASPQEATDCIRVSKPQLVLLDMNFSLSTTGEEGILLLRQIKLFHPDVPVILMTAWGSIRLAVEGMQAGAFDFVTKPWDNRALLQRIETALTLAPQNETSEYKGQLDRSAIIGCSKALNEVLETVERVAPTNASILITGESGTGKELIAEAIHKGSKRKEHPFVKVNLGGVSQSLFESEMFGHKKGAFTDAYMDRTGRFETAHRGSIFLDEIGELDLSCQVKLLRVLQDQTFEVLGDSKPRKVDIRVISATNADLRKMVSEKTFREDLFYRINLINIHLPALRERRDDIPLLVEHFARSVSKELGNAVEVSSEALSYLSALPFSGNIRELKNLVERTLLISGKSRIEKADFEKQCRTGEPSGADASLAMELTLEETERLRIRMAMSKYDGNLTHVAQELGITRQALYRRLEKYK
ncbi:MAG: sigma-54-dependent transcriptional regulator [Tannerellaceae bacterium]